MKLQKGPFYFDETILSILSVEWPILQLHLTTSRRLPTSAVEQLTYSVDFFPRILRKPFSSLTCIKDTRREDAREAAAEAAATGTVI
jgi:hypothetical protein